MCKDDRQPCKVIQQQRCENERIPWELGPPAPTGIEENNRPQFENGSFNCIRTASTNPRQGSCRKAKAKASWHWPEAADSSSAGGTLYDDSGDWSFFAGKPFSAPWACWTDGAPSSARRAFTALSIPYLCGPAPRHQHKTWLPSSNIDCLPLMLTGAGGRRQAHSPGLLHAALRGVFCCMRYSPAPTGGR